MRVLPGLFVVFLLGGGHHATADNLYSVTDLGSLPGTPDPTEAATCGHALNNTGQVTGTFTNIRGLYQAFLYSNGQIQNLARPRRH